MKLVILLLAMLMPAVAMAYQPIEVRQICGTRQILDAPAGQVIGQPDAGTQVTVRDFGFGADGRTYYGIDLRNGYVATEDAPHFCARPNEGVYRAPPNTCHLIAASRQTLPEVNAFARDHAEYLPTMSVYRASNGWHAISLGLVTLAAVGALLENAEGLPADSYCADGMNYIAALDQRGGMFSDSADSCLHGDAAACAARAEGIVAGDPTQMDNFEALRLWMLACMGGVVEACIRPNTLTPAYYDHALLTALPDADPTLGIMRDLARTACDAGVAEGCQKLAGRELTLNTDTPPEYFTALQAVTAGCMLDDQYACRDMFRLMERRETPPEDWYQAAQLRANICSHDPAAGDEFSCRPVYRAYRAFADATDDTRAAQARDYLHAACEGGNPDACLPPTAYDGFRPIALACQGGDAGACSNALSFYARYISATDIGALEAVLQAACAGNQIAGCETLAFVYGPHTLTGEDLHFQGTDQPEKRLAALQTGCRKGLDGLPNCSDLAKLYEARAEDTQAADTYRMACDTIRADSEAALYARGHAACFDAGLHALRKLDDRETARAYFTFVCNDPHQSEGRYACKHLGLMTSNAPEAFSLFQRACYPLQAERGDGEGCLLYGNALRDNLDRIALEGGAPALGTTTSDANTRWMVGQLASHAFATGCVSRWDASCAANQKVIAERLADDVAPSVPCQLRTNDGSVLADRTCAHIRFSETAEAEFDERVLVSTDVFVWPDGDRTLVQEQSGRWTLNGTPADLYFEDDETQCLTRHDTGNTLCVTLPMELP